jgi:hypothetical protein
MEFILLLIVVFLSAVSILLVLLQGIYKFEWISVKIIFSIDLLAFLTDVTLQPSIVCLAWL